MSEAEPIRFGPSPSPAEAQEPCLLYTSDAADE